MASYTNQTTETSMGTLSASHDCSFRVKVTPSAILSSPLPIRENSTLNEQSTSLGTREDGFSNVTVSLASVVSFETARKIDAVKTYSYTTNTSFTHENADQSNTSDHNEDNEEEDDIERIQKGRERNREHARRTRLRKKAQLQQLEQKYRSLIAERQVLNQQLQDQNVASILLGLSTITAPTTLTSDAVCSMADVGSETESDCMPGSKADDATYISDAALANTDQMPPTQRKRGFPSAQLPNNFSPLTVSINGVPTAISSKSHINWKTGIFCDESGRQSRMTAEQLEHLRYVPTFLVLFGRYSYRKYVLTLICHCTFLQFYIQS
jgi:hypothetical protein